MDLLTIADTLDNIKVSLMLSLSLSLNIYIYVYTIPLSLIFLTHTYICESLCQVNPNGQVIAKQRYDIKNPNNPNQSTRLNLDDPILPSVLRVGPDDHTRSESEGSENKEKNKVIFNSQGAAAQALAGIGQVSSLTSQYSPE